MKINKSPKPHAQKVWRKGNKKVHFHPLALAVSLAFGFSAPNITQAATYTVQSFSNSGLGSLREAIDKANNDTPNSHDNIVIDLSPLSRINLQSELVITDSVTITGPTPSDSNSFTLNAQNNHRHFDASSFPANSGKIVTLQNMKLVNGRSTSGQGGGAIYISNADLSLDNCEVSLNRTEITTGLSGGAVNAKNSNVVLNDTLLDKNFTSSILSLGGAIYINNGNLTLNNSILSSNATINADAGAAYVKDGNVILNQSTVTDNRNMGFSPSLASAIFVKNGGVTLNQSTISNNRPLAPVNPSFTAALFCSSCNSFVSINDSTISGNNAIGIRAPNAYIELYQSTVSNNTYGGIKTLQGNISISQSTITKNNAFGIKTNFDYSTYVNFSNSILFGNSTGVTNNLIDTSTSGNPTGTVNCYYSLFGDFASTTGLSDHCSYGFPSSSLLGPLQHNGGLTQTHKPINPLVAGVVDAGSNYLSSSFANDQRGNRFKRIQNTVVDRGAVELTNVNGTLNPDEVITRRDMAREILKAKEKDNFYVPINPTTTKPYAVTRTYNDVGIPDINAVFIEELERRGITTGCATDKFCPDMVVTRDSMAVILLKTRFGSGYNPDPPTGNVFNDVSGFNIYAKWIEDLDSIGLTIGCSATDFCPKEPVTRKWFNQLLTIFP